MIVICEPHHEGYQHVEFNAAFLAAARHAFQAPVLFLAEPGHLGLVAERTSRAGLDGIAYRALRACPSHASGAHQLFCATRRVREVLRLATLREARGVFFTSVEADSLFALKLLATGARVPCAVVPHGVLDSLAKGDGWFPRVLRMPNPTALGYLFLSRPVEQQVLGLVPSLAGATASVEHPYLFSAVPGEHQPAPPPLRFASVGSASRAALEALVDLARDARDHRAGKASFSHVGPVTDAQVADQARALVHFPSRGFLPREQYERELSGADYLLFLEPAASRFTVSGAVLDAVALARPLIGLRSPFLEHCFETLGDVGYLCDSPEQVRVLIHDLSGRFPRSHYAAQREQLLRGREVFTPKAVGEALRAAFTGWEARSGR